MIGINSTIIPVYINEISPLQINGMMGSCFQSMVCIGILMSLTLGLNVPTSSELAYNKLNGVSNNWWRVMFFVPVILSVMRMFAFSVFFKSDSAAYYVISKQKEKAEKALGEIYKGEHVEDELLMCQIMCKGSKQVSYNELFSSKYYYRLALGFVLPVIQQLSGINAILFYSTQII